MNWDAVAAIAELAGALGVIVSLVYLAKQISVTNENVAQNTTALFNQGEHASIDGILKMNLPQVESREVAELMLTAYSSSSALDEVDRYRFSALLRTQFESHQTFFLQNYRNSAGPETWSYYLALWTTTSKFLALRFGGNSHERISTQGLSPTSTRSYPENDVPVSCVDLLLFGTDKRTQNIPNNPMNWTLSRIRLSRPPQLTAFQCRFSLV